MELTQLCCEERLASCSGGKQPLLLSGDELSVAAVGGNLVSERPDTDPEQFSCLGAVPVRRFKRCKDVLLLDLIQGQGSLIGHGGR